MVAIKMSKPDNCADCPIQDKQLSKCSLSNLYCPMRGVLPNCPILDVEHLAAVTQHSVDDRLNMPIGVLDEYILRDLSMRIAKTIVDNRATAVLQTEHEDFNNSIRTRADVWVVKAGEVPKYQNSNFCVCCGEEIPEGLQVCRSCERSAVG